MTFALRLLRFSFVLGIIVCAGRVHGQSYSSVVVFGDSLSDTGNLANITQNTVGVRYPGTSFNYADGRFTDSTQTTPAAKAYTGVWVEQLANQFQAKPLVKDSLDGGTNYATGGATTADGFTVDKSTGISISVPNMGQQVTTYLATHPTPNASTLYVVFGGANDLFADNSSTSVTLTAQREAALIQRLVNAGATNFLIPNLPPLGSEPTYSSGPNATALNSAAAQFRTLLAMDLQAVKASAALGGISLTIFQPDLYTLFNQLIGSPASYAFANVTVSSQGMAVVLPDTYLFWDGIHPTTTGHHFIAITAEGLLSPPVSSTTTLTATPTPAAPGQTVTLKAVVTGTGPSAKPTGGVVFFNGTGAGATVLGTAVLDATGSGSASFAAGPAGTSYTVRAAYAGDLAYLNSLSASQTVVVSTNPIPTSTTLTASPLAAAVGAPVTLSANVTSSNGAPTGTVTFFDGSTSLGTGSLNGSGVATFTTTLLAAGTHTVTASYAAGGTYAGSTSAAVTITVSAPAISISFSPASLTVQHGSNGTVNVSLTPTGGASGTVTLTCGSLPAHTTCSFSPATLAISGTAVQTSTLSIGTNAVATLAIPQRPGSEAPRGTLYTVAFLPLLGLGLAVRGRRCRGRALFAVLLGLALAGAAGCGSTSTPASTTTTPGSYSVTVTATLAGSTPTVNQGGFTLVVQ